MKTTYLLKALFLTGLLAVFAFVAEPAFAQRGGHGGGGGFHGGGFHGGGGGGYHGGHNGGGYYGGHHGGGGYYGAGYYRSGYHGGWRGGYYGGSYRGYPGYGWGFGWGSGWGLGISVGWGGYWPGYSYDYGNVPAWPVPYYPAPSYYYAAPAGYAAAPGYAVAAPDYLGARSRGTAASAERPATNPAPATMSHGSSATVINASYRRDPAIRPEVRTVIRALQGMPPRARQGQLSRYTDLSPSERDLVIRVADVPES